MLEYEGTDISEVIDFNKMSKSKKCDICHYCHYYLKYKDIGFKYETYLCNGCQN